jgi:ketosteroid isomerase-like protein
MMQQARWIDPRPLANQRTRDADSLMQPNGDWAIGIVEAAAVPRVCPLDEGNARCQGLGGGVLRFSPPYAIGTSGEAGADSALVYARYSPLSHGVPSEIEFFVVRRDGAWHVASKRSMPEIAATSSRSGVADPQETVDGLLAADRAFATAAKATDLVSAISNMFVANVVMQAPGGHVRGRDSAVKALSANADNKRSRVEWTPVFAGVSSDGEHGFTVGYMTIMRPDGSAQPAKYVAYWVRAESGWRVAAYKRVPRPAGDVSLTVLPASLPVRALPSGDAATVQRYADELSLAEHAFSRDAGPMGLGAAFEKWGAPDAVNAGGQGSAEFVRGPQAIARSVSAGLTPDVRITWAPEQVIVSSTGDLGVSIGTIHIAQAATAGNAVAARDVPFFTIWKRRKPADPWRYVAE